MSRAGAVNFSGVLARLWEGTGVVGPGDLDRGGAQSRTDCQWGSFLVDPDRAGEGCEGWKEVANRGNVDGRVGAEAGKFLRLGE